MDFLADALILLTARARRSVADARPDSFTDAFFFSIETLANRLRARVHRHFDRPHLCPLLAAEGKLISAANPVVAMHSGTAVLDLTRAGALQPDIGDRQEQGWTERREERE